MIDNFKPTRPLIRYHGGKWRIAPWIISFFPEHRVYVEPYGGGGSVLIRKPRSYAEIYNDTGEEVVNLFSVVRDRGPELLSALELTPFARDEFDVSYVRPDCPVEWARRSVVRAYMGFGSNTYKRNLNGELERTGFRANSNRSGSTPARDWRNYPPHLVAIINRLQGVVIENRDALRVMAVHDAPSTLHYCDPPYVKSTRGDSGNDYPQEMTDGEHRAMACFLKTLKGSVIVSGYPSSLYDDELFMDWRRVERSAMADGARARTEVLWMKNVKQEWFT